MKTERMSVRLLPSDKKHIDRAAVEAGVSVAEYIRQSAIMSRVISANELQSIKSEINRIGVSINQLVRYAHQHHDISAITEDLKEKIIELDGALRKLQGVSG